MALSVRSILSNWFCESWRDARRGEVSEGLSQEQEKPYCAHLRHAQVLDGGYLVACNIRNQTGICSVGAVHGVLLLLEGKEGGTGQQQLFLTTPAPPTPQFNFVEVQRTHELWRS